MQIKYGISAINWVNEDVLELGDHYTSDDILRDMSDLGFLGTEFCRKFPHDVEQLKHKLGEYGLTLTSQWKSVKFSNPLNLAEQLQTFRDHVDFLHQMGCKHVVTCESSYSFSDSSGLRRNSLKEEEWPYLIDGLHIAGEYCNRLGMKLVYHFHAETVIERPEHISRLVESTKPELVHLLYDTGHAYYGGSDPLLLLQMYYDRIAYIHLKDVRQDVLDWKRANGIGFTEAVVKGLFTVPGDGSIDFRPIYRELHQRGYNGWIIIEAEQDPAIANPVTYAKKAKEYLNRISEDVF